MGKKEKLLEEQWLKFKKSEEKAKKSRIEVEGQLIEAYGLKFKGKSKTFKKEGSEFKVQLTKNIAYNLDQEKWIESRKLIPQNMRPEKISFSLDVKGFEWFKENEPELYEIISDCVEIKPNKTTVKVEKI